MILIKPKTGKKREEFTSSFNYIVEILICTEKNLNCVSSSGTSTDIQLFHTSNIKDFQHDISRHAHMMCI
jgi:hypothetical protein